jgi:hypothetical protein
MFKIITIAVLGYLFYRLFLVPRALNSPPTQDQIDDQDAKPTDDDFVEYEEVE